jgi:uncharacterized membrane protein SpoIIM required for sporulation/ABC-type transport system involved in multi-copper enzyme maturation permease subunit
MRESMSRSLSPLEGALIVARREIRDQMRDWRILTPILILTLFFPVLMNFTARQAVDFVGRYGAPLIGERLIPFLLMVVGFFPISISLVVALESFAGERERLSLEPLLATPLSDAHLYLGKMLASVALPLVGAYLGILVYLVGLALSIQWYPSPQLLIQILLLTTAQAIVMVSAAVVISSQATSVRAANLLASFVILPVAQLIIGESLIMFWGRYHILWWTVLGMLLIALVLGRMGLKLFNREELLGKEIDVINLRWAWKTFRNYFVGGARSFGEWYRGVIGTSLRRTRWGIACMTLALVAGFVIGWNVSGEFTLPPEVLQLDRLQDGMLEEMIGFGMLAGRGWLWVLGTNLRALALTALFGIFSVGVLATVLLSAPIGIIGYFAGNLMLAGQNVTLFLVALVLPHAVLEIPATILAGGSIISLGAVLISPPKGMSLGESWLQALAGWARINLGLVVPLLAAAAALEVFVTPLVALKLLAGA